MRIVPFVDVFVGGVSATFSYSAVLILPLKDFFNIQKILLNILLTLHLLKLEDWGQSLGIFFYL